VGSRVLVRSDFLAEADAVLPSLDVQGAGLHIGRGVSWSADQARLVRSGLLVDGVLAGALELSAASWLEGRGAVGSLRLSDAAVAPGGFGRVGALQVNGDAVFDHASQYFYDADQSGASDFLDIRGAARLAGTVIVAANAGAWSLRTRYTLLQAQAGVTGQFDSASSNLAFLTPEVTYSSDAAYLTLIRNDLEMASLGKSPNQRGVGRAIEAMGLGSAIYEAVVQMDVPSALAAFDALNGEAHATVRSALLRQGSVLVQQALSRAAEPIAGDAVAWTRGVADQWQVKGDGNIAAVTSHHHGATLGIEQPTGTGLAVGLELSRDQNSLEIDERGSRSGQSGQHAVGYARGRWGHWDAMAGAGYSEYRIRDAREIRLAGLQDDVTAHHAAQRQSLYAEVGYAAYAGNFMLRPALSASRHTLRSEGFEEQGQASALTVNPGHDRLHTVRASLGGRWDISAGQQDRAVVDMSMSWERRSGDLEVLVFQRFSNSGDFAVRGTSLARDVVALEAGISLSPSHNSRIRLGFQAGSEGETVRLAKLTYAISF
jgi:outer membrane autotransporter protein